MFHQKDFEERDDILLLVSLNWLDLAFLIGRVGETLKKSVFVIACRWKESELIYNLRTCIFSGLDIELQAHRSVLIEQGREPCGAQTLFSVAGGGGLLIYFKSTV